MKTGDRLRIEGVPYSVALVSAPHADSVHLVRVRRQISAKTFNSWLSARRWRRPSVSADFLVDVRTRKTIQNYQMLRIGIPSKRIERLHATLPLMPVGDNQ